MSAIFYNRELSLLQHPYCQIARTCKLYVTGQNVEPKQLLDGCPSGDCLHGTTIVKLDPATMKTRVIARLAPNPTFSDGTTALQIGDTIFIGSYRGDAVAYMKAPK